MNISSITTKWMLGLMSLGALYLVMTNPDGFYNLAVSLRNIVGGTERIVISGGRE